MAHQEIEGNWQSGGNEFSVVRVDGELLMVTPKTPAGYEPRLVPEGDGWVIAGGPFSGADVTLDGPDTGSIGGTWTLERADHPPAPVPGDGQRPPDLLPDSVRDEYFGQLWSFALAKGGAIRLADYPKYQFVQWLMGRDEVIFHGSGELDIEEFQPIRTSMELNDRTGRGNLGATYGTHDGLWAMFFAVIDRSRLQGTIRNGIADYANPEGGTLRIYRFSIHEALLETRPYRSGALYLLPRDRFARIPYYEGGPRSDEWACFEPVAPLAKILLDAEDFPFLETIGGHDDSAILAFGELGDRVWSGMTSASRNGEHIRIVTTADRAVIDEFVRLSLDFYPQVERVVTKVDGGHAIDMKGPPAFMQGIEQRLADDL
ncbi:MAG: hypothetical protein OEY55_06315 [Acidimicrobiia bacterium]|nr:hypothetical protein [Acidimicrobiia bacterium]